MAKMHLDSGATKRDYTMTPERRARIEKARAAGRRNPWPKPKHRVETGGGQLSDGASIRTARPGKL